MTACAPESLKGLIDSTPNVAVLINLIDYYAQRALPEKGVDSNVVYECPRTQLMIRTAVKGTTIGTHQGISAWGMNGPWTPCAATPSAG